MKRLNWLPRVGPAAALAICLLVSSAAAGAEEPERGSIRGVVLDAATGKPIEGAYVGTGDFGDSGGSNYSRHRRQGYHDSTKTDAAGEFALEGLAFTDKLAELKAHPLVVTHADYVRHDAKVELPSKGPVPEITVRLKPAARIDATVVDADGKPVPEPMLIRLEALDGRWFLPPGKNRDPHLSSFASSAWTERAAPSFSFTALDEGRYAIEAMSFRSPASTPSRGKGTIYGGLFFDADSTRYHGRAEVVVHAGEKRALEIRPATHGSTLNVVLPKLPEKGIHVGGKNVGLPPEGWMRHSFVVIGRKPGLLLWDDGKLHGLEDAVLGRIQLTSLLSGVAADCPTFTIHNLPPGMYTVFAGPFFKLAGARVEVVREQEVRIDIPWKNPDGQARGRLFALNNLVQIEGRPYGLEELCEILGSSTAPWLQFRAHPDLKDEKVTLGAREMYLWDLLESLHVDKGWRVQVDGEDTLVLEPGP